MTNTMGQSVLGAIKNSSSFLKALSLHGKVKIKDNNNQIVATIHSAGMPDFVIESFDGTMYYSSERAKRICESTPSGIIPKIFNSILSERIND